MTADAPRQPAKRAAPAGRLDDALHERLRAAVSVDEVVDAIDEEPLENRRPLRLRILAPMQAVVALLPLSGAGARVLDASASWGQIARVHRLRGSHVEMLDSDPVRLHVAGLHAAADDYRAGSLHPLPYENGRFDVVHLSLGSDGLAVGRGCQVSRRLTQGRLAEARRVLAPGGTLVVTSPNPLDPRPLRTGRRGAARDPRVGGSVPCAGRTPSSLPMTLRGLGLRPSPPFIWWPGSLDRHLLGTPPLVRRRLRDTGAIRSVPEGLRRFLGSTALLAPGCCVVARDSEPPGVASWAGSDVVFDVRYSSVVALSETSVGKCALTTAQREALRREVVATSLARQGPLREAAPRHVTFAEPQGVPVAGLERGAAVYEPRQVASALVPLLGGQPVVRRPLSSTDVWSAAHGHAWPRGLPLRLEDVRAGLRPLRDAEVPCGAVHGDLHADNVLRRSDGSVLLSDWDRYDPSAPLIIDALRLWWDDRARRRGSEDAALDDVLAGRLDGPLGRVVVARLGDLTHGQAALLLMALRLAQLATVDPAVMDEGYLRRMAGLARRCLGGEHR